MRSQTTNLSTDKSVGYLRAVHPLWPLAIINLIGCWWWRAIEHEQMINDPFGQGLLKAIERRVYHEERVIKLLGLDPAHLPV
jgi:hypothetical protein